MWFNGTSLSSTCSEVPPVLIDCWQVFEPFGPVELVQLPADLETGQSKGFGFVQVSGFVRDVL